MSELDSLFGAIWGIGFSRTISEFHLWLPHFLVEAQLLLRLFFAFALAFRSHFSFYWGQSQRVVYKFPSSN
jgi:hypothetical protein